MLSLSVLSCSNTIVIGFSGKACHGKDSAASAITAKYPHRGIKRYAFADNLKAEVFDALLDPNDPYWAVAKTGFDALPHPSEKWGSRNIQINWVNVNKEALGPTLQHYGTEYRRSQDPFYWVNKVRAQIEADRPSFGLITDVRYRNEIFFIKACRGYTVRIERVGYVSDHSRDTAHLSEIELDSTRFDYIISVPDGDKELLWAEAVEVFDAVVADQEPIGEFHASV